MLVALVMVARTKCGFPMSSFDSHGGGEGRKIGNKATAAVYSFSFCCDRKPDGGHQRKKGLLWLQLEGTSVKGEKSGVRRSRWLVMCHL